MMLRMSAERAPSAEHRNRFNYCPGYCEENVYLLAMKKIQEAAPGTLSVVVISNASHRVPIHAQLLSSHGYPVIWDYHVILIERYGGAYRVFDYDSTCEFPCDLEKYVLKSFRHHPLLTGKEFERKFRIINAEVYLRVFASDRSHMLRADGSWASEPPPWPKIFQADCANSMPELLDFDEHPGVVASGNFGFIVDFYGFMAHFQRIH